MMHFDSPHGRIALTDERKQHIIASHPDVAQHFAYFGTTLADPHLEKRSVHDPSVIICYRFLAHRKKYLAVVIKTGPRPFVLTAYLVKRPKGVTI